MEVMIKENFGHDYDARGEIQCFLVLKLNA